MSIFKRLAAVLAAALVMGASGCTMQDAFIQPATASADFYGAPTGQSDVRAVAVSYGLPVCERPAADVVPARAVRATLSRSSGDLTGSANRTPLSAGDLISVVISDDETFSGDYVIEANGDVAIPYVAAIPVGGATPFEAAERIERALVRQAMLLPGTFQVSVRVLHWSAIDVSVSGAVFEPGRVRINERRPEQLVEQHTKASGDFSVYRFPSEAIRAASGVRPDADLANVVLIRAGWRHVMDLTGLMEGLPADEIPLMSGDVIYVPSTDCFQADLVRPSQITMKGFRVFMSNLVLPAADNSSGAVGRYSTNLPYGARLLQAAVSANCVGGIQSTNASRTIVLASKNPLSGEMQVVERSVEALMRDAQNELVNPYLMPNDAVACYDSTITNIRDIARTISDLVRPFGIL